MERQNTSQSGERNGESPDANAARGSTPDPSNGSGGNGGHANGQNANRSMDRDALLASGRSARHPSASGESVNASAEGEARARAFAIEAAKTLKDDKCEDILILDVRGLSQYTDYVVIASGTSNVQMRSAGEDVAELAEGRGLSPLRDNLKEREANWLLIDLVDVVVHIFEPDTRLFYDLEMLWGDAPRVAWAADEDDVPGDGTTSRNRAGLKPGEAPE
jgi:ribosome-associated protein